MAWKTVNAAQSTDAQSQNAFRRFSNILMSHRNANGNIQYNPQDKSYRLVNDNGIFYSNGRFFSRSGAKGNYDINTGNFLKKKVNKPVTSVKQQSSTGSKDIVSQVTNPNYLYGYKEQVNKQNKIPMNSPATNKSRTTLAPKTSTSNSWINKGRGIWNYNGVSQADVANAYKTGDFSKVGSYLSQHRDLASYLNNIYSKRGGNQFNSSTKQATPIKGTPGYGIHVGNGSVTLSTPNGSTTDITNSHNVSTLINNGNYKAPNLGGMTTNYLENRPLNSYSELTKHNFDRGDIRQGMRANGINPYDYSGSDRKQLRTYLNNPTTDNYTQSVSKIIGDGKIQQNMLNNAVQNQTNQYQLTKPNLGYNPSQNNQLVNLKFKQGGQMYKYAAGAQMVQPQQTGGQDPIDQIAQIAAGFLQGDEASKKALIKVLSNKQIAPELLKAVNAGIEKQDKRAMIIDQAIKALQQGITRKARLGAKLDYIKQSIGECPEGQEVVYFKKGGEICKICAGKKMQDGGKSDPIKNFKKKKKMK